MECFVIVPPILATMIIYCWDILNTTYFRVTRGQRINFGPIMCIYIRHFEAINDPGRQFWLVNKNHFNAISFFVFMSMCKQQTLLLSSWSLKKVQQHFHFSGSYSISIYFLCSQNKQTQMRFLRLRLWHVLNVREEERANINIRHLRAITAKDTSLGSSTSNSKSI